MSAFEMELRSFHFLIFVMMVLVIVGFCFLVYCIVIRHPKILTWQCIPYLIRFFRNRSRREAPPSNDISLPEVTSFAVNIEDPLRPGSVTPLRNSTDGFGARHAILFQRQVALHNSEPPPLQHSTSGIGCEGTHASERRHSGNQLVPTEVHHGGYHDDRDTVSTHLGTGVSFRTPNRNNAIRIRHNSAGSSSSRGSVRSGGGSVRRDWRGPVATVASTSAGGPGMDYSATPPGSPRQSPLDSPRRIVTPRREPRCHSLCERLSIEHGLGEFVTTAGPIPLHLDTEPESGNDPVMDWDMDQGTPPHRTPSTDWTPLESSLDFWSQEHTRQSQRYYRARVKEEAETKRSKVRYNDTGSLEEVNVDHMVDYFLEDDMGINTELERETLRMQYRQLWNLRATFEDEEYVSEEGATTTSEITFQDEHSPPDTTDRLEQPTQNRSPLDLSPDPDPATSHTTSFESNTEPLLGDDPVRWPPHQLQLPSYEARRQTYKNILTSRLHRRQDTRHQRQTPLDNNSFDSLDTVDTEGSSTDVSRLEQVTTSFESTTDNTDSTGENQAHKLQQIRADSGYRSFETPTSRAPKLHRRTHFTLVDSAELEELVTPSEQDLQDIEEGFGRVSPAHLACSSAAGSRTFSKERQYSKNYISTASNKRREFVRDRYARESTSFFHSVCEVETESNSGNEESKDSKYTTNLTSFNSGVSTCAGSTATATTVVTTSPGGRGTKTILLPRYLRQGSRYSSMYAASIPQRDYSVDERSDALFREFSRCDPIYEPAENNRQRFHYRRLQHRANTGVEVDVHHRRSKLSPQDSIDEEYPFCREDQPNDIPIIRVADEDSSDQT